MARTMVVSITCDRLSAHDDEEVPASTYTWGEWEVDLCSQCAVPVQTAQALVQEYGSKGKRTPTPPSASKGPGPRGGVYGLSPAGGVKCPAEGCEAALKNRGSLSAHARQRHGMTLAELEGKPLTYQCERCSAAFSSAQGVALHTRSKHAAKRRGAAAKTAARKGKGR